MRKELLVNLLDGVTAALPLEGVLPSLVSCWIDDFERIHIDTSGDCLYAGFAVKRILEICTKKNLITPETQHFSGPGRDREKSSPDLELRIRGYQLKK